MTHFIFLYRERDGRWEFLGSGKPNPVSYQDGTVSNDWVEERIKFPKNIFLGYSVDCLVHNFIDGGGKIICAPVDWASRK